MVGEADLESLSDRSQIAKGINGKTRSGTQISWLLPVNSFFLFYIVPWSFPQKATENFKSLTNIGRRRKKANGAENISLQGKGTLTEWHIQSFVLEYIVKQMGCLGTPGHPWMLPFLLNDKTQTPSHPSQCLHVYHSLGLFASGHWIAQNCVCKLVIDSHQACELSASILGSPFGRLGWSNWSVCTISQVALMATCLTEEGLTSIPGVCVTARVGS